MVAALLLGLGCAAATLTPELPEERTAGLRLPRAQHLRAGSLTYRLGQIQRGPDGELRIDFRLQNGSSRDIEQGLLRVVAYGDEGRMVSGRLPFGALRRGQSRGMSARFSAVPFRLVDVGLEVIFVLP